MKPAPTVLARYFLVMYLSDRLEKGMVEVRVSLVAVRVSEAEWLVSTPNEVVWARARLSRSTPHPRP
jgi:hypothetical protein